MTVTVKLPQKAGFAPTVADWDQLVRIAAGLAAQLAQAQASAVETARIVGAERDAARAEVARLTAIVEKLQAERLDRLADSVAELDQQERCALRQPAPAQVQYPIDDEPCENCVHGKKWHWDGGKCQNACPCSQYQPAPAGGEAREWTNLTNCF